MSEPDHTQELDALRMEIHDLAYGLVDTDSFWRKLDEAIDAYATAACERAIPPLKRSCYLGDEHDWEHSPYVLDSMPPIYGAKCKKCLLEKSYSKDFESYNACGAYNQAIDDMRANLGRPQPTGESK